MRLLKDNNDPKLWRFLNEHYLDNLNLIGILKSRPNSPVYVNDGDAVNGVVIERDDHGPYCYIVNGYTEAFAEEAVRDLFSKPDCVFLSGVRCTFADVLNKFSARKLDDPIDDYCKLYYYPNKTVDTSEVPVEVRDLALSDSETVNYFYTYRNSHSLKRIQDEILNRPSSALNVDDELASWALVHSDYSMGSMFTKPQFRRRDFGYYITLSLMDKLVKQNMTPYVHIVSVNNASIKLAEFCGMIYGYDVIWYETSFKE